MFQDGAVLWLVGTNCGDVLPDFTSASDAKVVLVTLNTEEKNVFGQSEGTGLEGCVR